MVSIMFNLGLPEILVISVAALLVFGPRRLPELANGLGKGIRDFKKALEGSGAEEEKALPPESKDAIDVRQKETHVPPATENSDSSPEPKG